MTTLTKKTLEYYEEDELNALIEETFGKPYHIQQSGDMIANDTWNYFVLGEGNWHYDENKNWVAYTVEEEEALIAEWQASTPPQYHSPGREPDPPASVLLDALHRRGLLPLDDDSDDIYKSEGIYIHVSW